MTGVGIELSQTLVWTAKERKRKLKKGKERKRKERKLNDKKGGFLPRCQYLAHLSRLSKGKESKRKETKD